MILWYAHLLGMGAGTASGGGGPSVVVVGIHKRNGVVQPDVPVVSGGHGTS